METDFTRKKEKDLWLIVKIKNQLYALNTNNVESIFELDQEVINLPNTNPAILGAITVRESVVPLMDLRLALGIEPLSQEQLAFE